MFAGRRFKLKQTTNCLATLPHAVSGHGFAQSQLSKDARGVEANRTSHGQVVSNPLGWLAMPSFNKMGEKNAVAL